MLVHCCLSRVIVDYFFFFKQKTAYEMRISDWSSTCALPIYHVVEMQQAAGDLRLRGQAAGDVFHHAGPRIAEVGRRLVAAQILDADLDGAGGLAPQDRKSVV